MCVSFLELSTNKEDKVQIKNIISDSKALEEGSKINSFTIYDYLKTPHSIKDIIKGKESFVFFWNPKYISKNYISSRMKFLSNKYPTINFIQVKIGEGNSNRIKGLDIKNQYYVDDKSEANLFLKSKLPRAIIIDEKGLVVHGFASISSKSLYPFLNELAKK